MNLNKFTKADLISKLKKLESKIDSSKNQINIKSYFNQLWELLVTFKSLLLKLTLISLIINLYNRYSILSKLWRVLTSIVMFIFGLNLIDNFGFDFFSNFIKELKYITHNIIYYITQTQFYQYITELFKGPSKDIPIENNEEDTPIPSREQKGISRKNTADEQGIKESQKGIRESQRDSKISEWLKPTEPEIISEENEYYDSWKVYLITGTIIVAGCIIWVYSDEIKSSLTTFYEWVTSFRPGAGDSPGSGDQNTREHPRTDIQKRLKDAAKERFKEQNTVKVLPNPTDIFEDELPSPEIVMTEEIGKGKGKEILTSPSLEDLNNKATELWAEGTSSPKSDGSDVTIKPSSSKVKITSIEELSPGESSVSKILHKSDPLTSSLNIDTIINSLHPEWRDLVNERYNEKIKRIEFMFEKARPIDIRTLTELGINYAELLQEYELLVNTFNKMKESNNYSDIHLFRIKSTAYYFKSWLASYNKLIFRDQAYNITIGNFACDPISIMDNPE
jgi:hypothetical protein